MNEQDIKKVKESFLKLTNARLKRTKELMRPKEVDFLDFLPLLFHVNHQSLPGFAGHNVPAGLAAYNPPESLLARAKKLWPSFDMPRKAQWNYDVQALFLMGSAGTVAFSKKSDFDVWLCHRPDLPQPQLDALQRKAVVVEQWAADLGLEVHFFVMNAERFAEGEVAALSSESSGSAQHKLLLDEFYRTGLWVGGKMPLWWFVPPDREADYAALKSEYFDRGVVTDREVIDLGALPSIPTEEFFGAAVWQMYKGVESPYKSVLKITLMEAYANSFPEGRPLATEFKQKVYDGVEDVEELDPYLMMLARLEEYLQKKREDMRLELIRRSFYMKLTLPMSIQVRKENWRHAFGRRLIERWGWTEGRVEMMDRRKEWSIMEVLDERKLLTEHLTKSYAFLSDYARSNAERIAIAQKDLTVLGRKLYSVFDRKPGKIELFNRGIAENIEEAKLTFFLAKTKDKQDRWLLFRDKVTANTVDKFKPIKTSANLIQLLSWCYFNQVTGNTTQKLVFAPGREVNASDLVSIEEHFNRHAAGGKLKFPSSSDLLHHPRAVKASLFINVGQAPLIVGSRMDKGIVTGNVDILQYANGEKGGIVTLESVELNSWCEVFVHHHKGMTGLFQWVCDYLNQGLAVRDRGRNHKLPEPDFVCYSSQLGHTLSTRVGEVYHACYELFLGDYASPDGVFIFEFVRTFFVIRKQQGKLCVEHINSLSELVSLLSSATETFRKIVLDNWAMRNVPLRLVLKENKPGVIQLFYTLTSGQMVFYVLDENGALFYQKFKTTEVEAVLPIYYQLFRAVICRRDLADTDEASREKVFDRNAGQYLELYEVRKDGLEYHLHEKDVGHFRMRPARGVIEASGEVRQRRRVFTFNIGKELVTSEEHGNRVFNEAVASFEKTFGRRSIVIGKLSLDPRLLGNDAINPRQTIHALKYKKLLEGKLRQARSKS